MTKKKTKMQDTLDNIPKGMKIEIGIAPIAGARRMVFKVKPDLNGDGCVNTKDVPILVNCLGEYRKKCDLNSDGIISDKDFKVFEGFYEAGCE